ncbi:lethal giant larvae like, C-terminal-domain-containing protein [Bombardia bombarda]|uniref:Lethal giant larvae like, C-terminal-domain-containing protein n=1 Tax=Bombardia bombarda TaxID=252184 RepID=A0AA39X0Z8_9PEZI|nr:lethal giant larvae like, C-terminal-domain-containing protein [Bombardia bombarda]
MAGFLRAKQAGMQNDLSAGIMPATFAPEEQTRYGINSQISCLAYEPTQSLLAVGTNESRFGPGQIYVFGQSRVTKFYHHPSPKSTTLSSSSSTTSYRHLRFVANRLISLDARNELAIWDLDTATQLARYTYPGACALLTDPMLDWALVGLANGDVFAYDLDRERPSPFRIPNLWREGRDPRDLHARSAGLVGMELHPRDIGRLLIAYTHGAVIYSFKQNEPVRFLEYELPAGAPGGNGEGVGVGGVRRPRLTQATWHPSGQYVLTAHEDGSLVFWDVKEGRLVTARSLGDVRVNQPGKGQGKAVQRAPFTKIAWCCKENPDDTALLIAGGHVVGEEEVGMTFLELGPTPIYATSTWEILAAHFEGRRRLTLQTPPGARAVGFCLVPRSSPYFGGAQDPIAIITRLSSGELITLSFPSGYPISPTNMLHPSLSLVHPFVHKIAVSTLDRGRWLGMTETRSRGEMLLKGGAMGAKRRRRYEGRNIIQVAHADSTIRMWDVGHGDEIENPEQLQVDIARALDRYEDVEVTAMDMAETTGEFAAGTAAGELVIYKWGGNNSRAEPSLKEGLQPFVLYEMMRGPVTVVSVSDVGFVAVGSANGGIAILDLRGPAVIYSGSTADFAKLEKKSLFKSHHSGSAGSAKEYAIVIEFGVMTLEGDSYSSIACFVGTNLGHVATFKLLPAAGGYTAKLAGVTASMGDRVVSISPISADTGNQAGATGPVVASLRDGHQVNGILVVATQKEARIFKPVAAKGASKSFDSGGAVCTAAAVAEYELHGFALVAVFTDRTTRAYSIPGLKEIGRKTLSMLDAGRTDATVVTKSGDILGWTGPSELVVIPVWEGSGTGGGNSQDTIVNPDLTMPARPTISNLQWISGTQYVSPTDLDLLIGGPDRPPSKRMLLATAAEERQARIGNAVRGGAAGAGTQEGWGDYLTRQLNERTEKLNIMGDSMDNLEKSSQGWADDVGKYVSKQKRSMLLGGLPRVFMILSNWGWLCVGFRSVAQPDTCNTELPFIVMVG